MKFSILKENLKQGLFSTGHLAGKNINLPILNNVLVDAKKDNLKIITTNLEIGITCFLRGKVEKEGVAAVDAKIFSDYIGLLPNKKIDIAGDGNFLGVGCENYKTKIKTENPEDFPLIPEVERVNEVKISAKELKKALSKTVFAVSNNEARAELSGVLFSFVKNKLFLAATDSYRLAEKEIELVARSKESEEQKIIVPAKTIQEILRILSNLEAAGAEEVIFYVNDNQILFVADGTEVFSRLIEGQYPDYKQIIPGSAKTTAIISRSELVRAIKASALFSKTGINDVNLDFPSGQNKIIVSSASGNAGENIASIEAEVRGSDNAIVVNYQYLLDGLNNVDEDNVKIEIIDGNTPCLLKPLNEKGYLYIIMPIKQ
jgi:DNA polymerase III subunit beta